MKNKEQEEENKLIELAEERNDLLRTIKSNTDYIFWILFIPVVLTVAYYAMNQS